MFNLGTVVLVGLVIWGLRRGSLLPGSILTGLLVGLAIASSGAGKPVGDAVRTSSSAIGTAIVTSAQASYRAAIDQ